MCGAFGSFAHQAYTACLRGQLSSNVRPHTQDPGVHMSSTTKFALRAGILCWAVLMGFSISEVDQGASFSFWAPPLVGGALALVGMRVGPPLFERISMSIPPMPEGEPTGHKTCLAGLFICSLGWLMAVFLHHRTGLAIGLVGANVFLVGFAIIFIARRSASKA